MAKSLNSTSWSAKRVMKRQTFPALKEYLLKDRPTQQTDAVEAAEPEAVGALDSAAEVAVVPNQRDLIEMPTLARKMTPMTQLKKAQHPWPRTPGVNLPMYPGVVGVGGVAPDSSAAVSFDVAVAVTDILSTSTKKAAVNERAVTFDITSIPKMAAMVIKRKDL